MSAQDSKVVSNVVARVAAADAAQLRKKVARGLKYLKDLRDPRFHDFEEKNPELARRSVQMVASDTIYLLEDIDQFLAKLDK